MKIDYEKQDRTYLTEVDTIQDAIAFMKKYCKDNKRRYHYLHWIYLDDEMRVDYGSHTEFFWLYELPKDFRKEWKEYADKYTEERNKDYV